MEELRGIVARIIFASNDNKFGVFILETELGRISVTISSTVPKEGEEVKIKGDWTEHPKYGRQFKANSCITVIPTKAEDILRFLSSGNVEGVGPAIAEKIVNVFGSETLNIILNQPEKLLALPKIGHKTAEKIHNSLKEQMDIMDFYLWLEEKGLSTSYAHRLYEIFGSFAMQVLESRPYSIISKVQGFGFITADQIAQTLGYPPDHKERIKAAFHYVIQQSSYNGHCCIPHHELLKKTTELLGLDPEIIRDAYNFMLENNQLYLEEFQNHQLIYTRKFYQAEDFVAKGLLTLQDNAFPVDFNAPQAAIHQWEVINDIRLAPQQIDAMEAALNHGILVITGGPGTGKTTIIKGIISLLSKAGQTIILAAPTGRAAKRLAETCDKPAYTIHRLLQRCTKDNLMEDNHDPKDIEPLDTDVLIVDEMSMVDVVLMQRLLEILPLGCRLILVGDVDQLPAVGAGLVLKDIIRSQSFPTIKLTNIFRQSNESTIITNAHRINQGLLPILKQSADFQFIEMEDNEAIAQEILNLCQSTLAKEGYSVFSNIQILSPMHKMACGVENLNKLLQAKLNPPSSTKPELEYKQKIFRVGDKVMHIVNNYQKSVFNGDVGIISDMTGEEIFVTYPDQIVTYTKDLLEQLTHAYAISVHKSQGSEYPVVILPLSMSHSIMMQRNLLYTAITRAKEKVIIIGSLRALKLAVGNNRPQRRYTLLANRLNNSLE